MDTAKRRIEALAREFVDRLQAIARDELLTVLGGAPNGLRPTRGRGSASARGAKREPAALEQLAERFLSYVAKHPGLRIEQINAELGSSTKELALPIRKLLAAKQLRAEGQRRSTKYFPTGGAGRPAKGAKRTRGKKRSKR